MKNVDKVVGVLGGMGPQATVDFFQKVIDMTPVKGDQDHIHLIIDNNPKTPDRTACILGKENNLQKVLVSAAVRLQLMGADFLVMPCNTAHFFYDEIIKYIDIPFVNMIEEVAIEIKSRYGSGTTACLLATPGTYEGRVYERMLYKYGINMVVPGEKEKKIVYDAVYGIKEGLSKIDIRELCTVVNQMKERGVPVIILGCTELPLIQKDLPRGIDYVSSTDVLARKTVELAKGIE